jgi:hypothetical protein
LLRAFIDEFDAEDDVELVIVSDSKLTRDGVRMDTFAEQLKVLVLLCCSPTHHALAIATVEMLCGACRRRQEQKRRGTLVSSLMKYYQKHAPDKVRRVDAALEHFKGKEAKLLSQLEAKYGTSGKST